MILNRAKLDIKPLAAKQLEEKTQKTFPAGELIKLHKAQHWQSLMSKSSQAVTAHIMRNASAIKHYEVCKPY